jgi:hypothetical protein
MADIVLTNPRFEISLLGFEVSNRLKLPDRQNRGLIAGSRSIFSNPQRNGPARFGSSRSLGKNNAGLSISLT